MSTTKSQSIARLPALAHLNGVKFDNVQVSSSAKDREGLGIIAAKDFDVKNAQQGDILLRIPQDLVLSHEAVLEYARIDRHFKNFLNALEMQSKKHQIMLFLLYQGLIATSDKHSSGVSSFWAEYTRVLPEIVYLPTQYTEEQRCMLRGTSLENTLDMKNYTLDNHHSLILAAIRDLEGGPDALWFQDTDISLKDWIHADALFRSRSLEIPGLGESMAPFIDMANHSLAASAFYDRDMNSSEVVLQLLPDSSAVAGAEITICYGSDKSAAEMLFTYGFIDDAQDATSVVLDLEVPGDDPLGRAKDAAITLTGRRSDKTAKLYINATGELIYDSPFLYLLMLNEEDGLEFKVTHHVDGELGDLHTIFNGIDVSHRTHEFKEILESHPQKDLIDLRCVVFLTNLVRSRLDALIGSHDVALEISERSENSHIGPYAIRLRQLEETLYHEAHEELERETTRLLNIPSIQEYLGYDQEEEPLSTNDPDQRSDEDDYS